jgi:hypothetical protein
MCDCGVGKISLSALHIATLLHVQLPVGYCFMVFLDFRDKFVEVRLTPYILGACFKLQSTRFYSYDRDGSVVLYESFWV